MNPIVSQCIQYFHTNGADRDGSYSHVLLLIVALAAATTAAVSLLLCQNRTHKERRY